jgi:hypothetical protein
MILPFAAIHCLALLFCLSYRTLFIYALVYADLYLLLAFGQRLNDFYGSGLLSPLVSRMFTA